MRLGVEGMDAVKIIDDRIICYSFQYNGLGMALGIGLLLAAMCDDIDLMMTE